MSSSVADSTRVREPMSLLGQGKAPKWQPVHLLSHPNLCIVLTNMATGEMSEWFQQWAIPKLISLARLVETSKFSFGTLHHILS